MCVCASSFVNITTNNLVNSFVLRTINEDALKDALRAVSTKLRERLLLINDLLHFLLYIYFNDIKIVSISWIYFTTKVFHKRG